MFGQLLAERGEGLDVVDHGATPLPGVGVGHVQTVRPRAEVGRAVGELERLVAPARAHLPGAGRRLQRLRHELAADPHARAFDARPRGRVHLERGLPHDLDPALPQHAQGGFVHALAVLLRPTHGWQACPPVTSSWSIVLVPAHAPGASSLCRQNRTMSSSIRRRSVRRRASSSRLAPSSPAAVLRFERSRQMVDERRREQASSLVEPPVSPQAAAGLAAGGGQAGRQELPCCRTRGRSHERPLGPAPACAAAATCSDSRRVSPHVAAAASACEQSVRLRRPIRQAELDRLPAAGVVERARLARVDHPREVGRPAPPEGHTHQRLPIARDSSRVARAPPARRTAADTTWARCCRTRTGSGRA